MFYILPKLRMKAYLFSARLYYVSYLLLVVFAVWFSLKVDYIMSALYIGA